MPVVDLADGRRAQLWLGGAEDGPVVLFFHGCPDTRWAARTGEAAARACGVRLLCVNRPGYGRSDPDATTFASVAADATEVAESLGIGRVAVLGMSMGGAYAAAFAVRDPERVRALGVVAAPAMSPPVEMPVEVALEGYRPGFEEYVARIRPEDPDDEALVARWTSELPAPDAEALRALPPAEVAAAAREALAQPDGYLRDAALVLREWDFDLADVTTPTHLWFGADDDRNPPSVGHWWASRIDGARLVVRPGTTHLATLLDHWPDVLTTLRRYLD